MPANPAIPPQVSPDARLAERLGALERKVRTLEAFLQGGALQQVPVVSVLPKAGRKGRLLILSGDTKLYRDDGVSWIPVG